MVRQEVRKRTVWLNEEEWIVSFHFVDGYRRKDLTCRDEAYICFLQVLQIQGYRFQ